LGRKAYRMTGDLVVWVGISPEWQEGTKHCPYRRRPCWLEHNEREQRDSPELYRGVGQWVGAL
jgi:hypothetical protein